MKSKSKSKPIGFQSSYLEPAQVSSRWVGSYWFWDYPILMGTSLKISLECERDVKNIDKIMILNVIK